MKREDSMLRLITIASFFLLYAVGCEKQNTDKVKPVKESTDEEKILDEINSGLTSWTLGEDWVEYRQRRGRVRGLEFTAGLDWMNGAVLLNYEIKGGVRECDPLKPAHPRQLPGTKTYKITTVLTFQSRAKTELKVQRLYIAQRIQYLKDSPSYTGVPVTWTEDDLKPYWEIQNERD